MTSTKIRVVSWILIICMILSSKTMFVFADTFNMSNVELIENDTYVENEIKERSSESDVKDFDNDEDDNLVRNLKKTY